MQSFIYKVLKNWDFTTQQPTAIPVCALWFCLVFFSPIRFPSGLQACKSLSCETTAVVASVSQRLPSNYFIAQWPLIPSWGFHKVAQIWSSIPMILLPVENSSTREKMDELQISNICSLLLREVCSLQHKAVRLCTACDYATVCLTMILNNHSWSGSPKVLSHKLQLTHDPSCGYKGQLLALNQRGPILTIITNSWRGGGGSLAT